MRLKSKIKFADEKLKYQFDQMKISSRKEKEIFVFIEQAFHNLEENCFCGTQIPKKLIPKEYIKKYGIDNCWKYNLPGAWRLIYSIERDEVVVLSVILEWLKHKDYEKRFNY